MTKKKQYKNQLPSLTPPSPRTASDQEATAPPIPGQAAKPELEQVNEAIRQLVRDLDDDLDETTPVLVSAPGQRPEPMPRPEPERVALRAAPRQPAAPARRRPQLVLIRIVAVGLLVAFGGGYLLTRLLGETGTASGATGVVASSFLGAPTALGPGESYVDSEVRRGGDVVVRQWIRSAKPIDQVWLTLPVTGATDALAADEIEVQVDGGAVVGPAALDQGQAIYTFSQTTAVRISYVLRGAVQTSDSAPGRALALATSIDVRVAAGTMRETRVVRAQQVLSLGCATLAEDVTPCGDPLSRQQWSVELDGEQLADRVVAQVELKR